MSGKTIDDGTGWGFEAADTNEVRLRWCEASDIEEKYSCAKTHLPMAMDEIDWLRKQLAEARKAAWAWAKAFDEIRWHGDVARDAANAMDAAEEIMESWPKEPSE